MQTPLDAPQNLLPEEKARVEVHQPGFIEARTSGLLRGELNTYPVLLTPQQSGPGVPVLGYLENKEAIGVDRTFWKLYASPTYNFQHNQPFAYLGALDPTLGPDQHVPVASIWASLKFDFRDNPLHPHKGVYLLNDFQIAGLGGDAHDVRDQPDARAYIPVSKKVTWAWRGSMGFLDPFDYGGTIDDPTAQADEPGGVGARIRSSFISADSSPAARRRTVVTRSTESVRTEPFRSSIRRFKRRSRQIFANYLRSQPAYVRRLALRCPARWLHDVGSVQRSPGERERAVRDRIFLRRERRRAAAGVLPLSRTPVPATYLSMWRRRSVRHFPVGPDSASISVTAFPA